MLFEPEERFCDIMTLNRYIYRKESEPMPTESVKITEKNTLSSAEADSPLRRELDEFLFHEGTARRAHAALKFSRLVRDNIPIEVGQK